MTLFRKLSVDEEWDFRQWARKNYVPFSDIRGIWHPVVQDECRKMNEDAEFLPSLPKEAKMKHEETQPDDGTDER